MLRVKQRGAADAPGLGARHAMGRNNHDKIDRSPTPMQTGCSLRRRQCTAW
jgi:hypothetical protein